MAHQPSSSSSAQSPSSNPLPTQPSSGDLSARQPPQRIPALRTATEPAALLSTSLSSHFTSHLNTPPSAQRRLSTQERIDSILESAHQRGLVMRNGSPDPGGIAHPGWSLGGAPLSRQQSRVSETAPETPIAESPNQETESSSADEHTSIMKGSKDRMKSYQSTQQTSTMRERRRSHSSIRRNQQTRGRRGQNLNGNGGAGGDYNSEEESDDQETRWKKLLSKFGSVELDNKGSVARDHLALERTFLAWLRTSLSFASIGIAITQLFRLNTSLANTPGASPDAYIHLRQLGKPLGATFLGISILVLFVGFHRYFESQHWIIRGKFPASRGSVAFIAIVAVALMVTSLVVVLVAGPGAFEK